MNKLWAMLKKRHGFTITELLIGMVIMGILATISILNFRGFHDRTQATVYQGDIQKVKLMIESYRNEHNEYPNTTNNPKSNWKASEVFIDSNCTTTGGAQRVADWVPFLDEELPLSNVSATSGVNNLPGCYMYVSNGVEYVLSAWNVYAEPKTGEGYRRLGFRKFTGSDSSTQFYTCNANVEGGQSGGYDASQDYYKHSYTLSNITDCDETPPPGA